MTLTGLDRIAAGEAQALTAIRGQRLGLLAHAASVDRRLQPAMSVLRQAGATLEALFGPEHGFSGAAQDMIGVETEGGAGLPVYSLYGDREEDLFPRAEWLEGLDRIVIDMQDVGSRYYTYVWTAALMLRAAAEAGVEVLVLDRPNPLGGLTVEGPPQREGYLSFVGLYPVAVRHGMTIGELLRWVQQREGIPPEALQVLQMEGWHRGMSWEETGLPWVMPSPNMPTLDTARVYPGGCLIEGTLLSEGRGTTRPFELWGGPDLDVSVLGGLELRGARLRPIEFRPTFQKHGGKPCRGVQVHITDPRLFEPYEAYQQMLAAVLPAVAADSRWRTEVYEYVTDRPAIDLLTGGPEFRDLVDAGGALAELDGLGAQSAHVFQQTREAALLYPK